MYTNQWRRDFYEINPESISGGKLNIYRHVKNTLATKGYILNMMQSVWGRRVLAGLRIGWLSLAVATGRCSKTPYCEFERVCRLCDRREVEDQSYVYVRICPAVTDLQILPLQLTIYHAFYIYCH